MKQCPTCEGSKKQTVTVHDAGKISQIQIGCITCGGVGTITPAKEAQLEYERNMWCRCGNPSGQTTYFADGEHAEIHKHHWRCGDCSKVIQIG